MPSISLYTQSPDSYDKLQHYRPDYVGAQKAFVELATKYLKGKNDISVVDFCCGTGGDSRLLAEHVSVDTATLVDINKEFLDIAKEKGIKARTVHTIQSDILTVDLPPYNDAVISMFAYHHVTDDRKAGYVAKAKTALKPGGILTLGEIYSPDKQTTLDYYEHLSRSIPATGKGDDEALRTFLRQTAESDDFEYKVSRAFAHDQLIVAGFKLLESRKVWPTDDTFPADVGTFVEVWGISQMSDFTEPCRLL